MITDKQEVFKSKIERNWMLPVRDLLSREGLLRYLHHPQAEITEPEFKSLLSDAIRNLRFSVEEYEALTEVACDSREEVAQDLMELWKLVFGDEPLER
jgi:hypothetical protein